MPPFDESSLTPRHGPVSGPSREDHTPVELERTRTVFNNFIPGYELIEQIGRGGYGRVYKARQIKLDRLVALKVIAIDTLGDPGAADQCEAEALLLARFRHPRIVHVYDFGRTDRHMFLAMELLDGKDLGVWLQDHGRFDERATWSVILQAAAGLAHAAKHGVVHRDVKPSNLFLSEAPPGSDLAPGVPAVMVTDFGLALAKWGVDPTGRRTPPGVAVGTPAYMAPEQHRGGCVDHRADIYALGATAYHALAGAMPFSGPTVWDVMARKLEHAPPPLPPGFEDSAALIRAMTAPDLRHRIQTYEELVERITRLPCFRDRAPRHDTAPTPRRWRRAAALGAVALAVTGAAVAAVAAVSGLGGPDPLPPQGRYQSDGNQGALFDGSSLAPWAASGVWSVDADEEGTAVLVGSGLIRRPFSPPADYRVTLGLDVYEASAAEVHFAIPTTSPTAPRLVLRVSKGEGAVLGTREGDRGPFRPAGPAVPFPSANWLKGRRPYLEVRVERAGGVWSAWFHGQPVGRVADDGTPKAGELRLAAEDGRVRLDTAVLEHLSPVAP